MDDIRAIFRASADIALSFAEEYAEQIDRTATLISTAFQTGNKLLVFGNGGSAADAQHIAAEFVNRYLLDRSPLPAIALTTDSSILTSISNDYSFDEVFSKQIRALGKPGDIALGITTSGTSPNILAGFAASRDMGLTTIAFTGKNGGPAAAMADINFTVRTDRTPRIQEVHSILAHVICELVEKRIVQQCQK